MTTRNCWPSLALGFLWCNRLCRLRTFRNFLPAESGGILDLDKVLVRGSAIQRDLDSQSPSSIIHRRSVPLESRWPWSSASFSQANVGPKSGWRSRTSSIAARRTDASIALFGRLPRRPDAKPAAPRSRQRATRRFTRRTPRPRRTDASRWPRRLSATCATTATRSASAIVRTPSGNAKTHPPHKAKRGHFSFAQRGHYGFALTHSCDSMHMSAFTRGVEHAGLRN